MTALSGIAEVSDDVTVTEEGEGQTFTGTAAEKAGNTAETSATVNLDKTPPEITGTLTPATVSI